MKRILTATVVLALALVVFGLLPTAAAQNRTARTQPNDTPIAKGKVILSFQFTELAATAVDTTDMASLNGDADNPQLFASSLVGGKTAVSVGLNEMWALNGAFIWATGYDNREPVATVGGPEKIKVNAVGVRFGIDRHVQLANRVSFYAGPGLQWMSVGSEITEGATTAKNPRVNTLSLSGRMGAFIRVSETFGLYGDLGHRLSSTSKTVRGKASAVTSGQDGNIGFAVIF